MGKFKIFIHTLLVAISPALFVYPQTPSVEQISPETLNYGAKIIEANKQTIALAEELGMSTNTTSQLKRAGALEKNQAAMMEQWTPEMRQSCEVFKEAEAFLKTRNKYMTETEARELIHQKGIKTFPRPAGIPENYRIKFTNDGAGIKYVHPTDEGTYVRVMPGKPYSEYPYQQKPYVAQKKNGQSLNNLGEPVGKQELEAHIPLEEFIFRLE